MKNNIVFLKKQIRKRFEIYFLRKKLNFIKNKKYAFVMLSATYENLGDIAITLTQIKFLKNILSDEYQIIEVPVEDTYKVYLDMKKHIKNDSIITLIGGGNNGDMYEFVEKMRRFILEEFSNYKIISFPQTVTFNENGIYLKKFIEDCNNCNNLHIVAREKKSYEFYKKITKNNVLLTPDIVFYEDFLKEYKRTGISLIMRNDKEKNNNNLSEDEIIEILNQMNIRDISYNDTCSISLKEGRETVFANYIDTISRKKLVITDRLHGMIIAYITNTPCIAFDNSNHKILETYNTWLKNQNYIILHNNGDEKLLKKEIEKLINIKKVEKDNLSIKYKDIEKILKGELR